MSDTLGDVKFLGVQISQFLSTAEVRGNVRVLSLYLAFMAAVTLAFAALFHVIMVHEGQDHSWLTGLYWTLTVMTTLGFGDITFRTDIGRLFSIVVMLTGNILLLIVLPFAFIRFLLAPWLETQVRFRAPRAVADDVHGHVVACRWDAVAAALGEKLRAFGVPFFVLEPDPARAAYLVGEGVPVVTGDPEARTTWAAVGAARARAVVANLDDPANTNVTLTVREESSDVAVLSLANRNESVDLLELAGASTVVPLGRELGEQLARRAASRFGAVFHLGAIDDLLVVEIAVDGTSLVGRSLRELDLRRRTGITIVGAWQRGQLVPAAADLVPRAHGVLVAVGTTAQVEALEAMLDEEDGVRGDEAGALVLVIGGGRVGCAATAALLAEGCDVRVVEHDRDVAAELVRTGWDVVVGSAAERRVLEEAGLDQATAVIVTTNDDAMNVYLSIYLRRLRPEVRIAARVTHEKNQEALWRAGADFVASQASLGKEALYAALEKRALIFLGEGVDFFHVRVPPPLAGKTLGQCGVGARTGLQIVAIRRHGHAEPSPGVASVLHEGDELLVVGTSAQRSAFAREFERASQPA
jgi:Trk K+ transport system NAD-binding subunit